jgi:hypothetical protein
MANRKTYVIVCKQGNLRQECPLFLQKGIPCVECPYVAYVERVRPEETTEHEQEEKHEQ